MLGRLRLLLEQRLAKLTGGTSEVRTPAQIAVESDIQHLRELGNRHLALSQWKEAETFFRQAQSLDVDDVNTLTCLGYVLKEQGRYSEARIFLRRVLSLLGSVPAAHDAHYLIGQIALLEGDLQNARDHFLEVLRLVPEFQLACSDLIRVYTELNQVNEITLLLAQCCAKCPKNTNYMYWHGNWLLERKLFKSAIEVFDRFLELEPGIAEVYCNQGMAYQAVDQLDNAMRCYNQAVEMKPELAQAYSNRGAIHKLNNQFDLAIADFSEAIRISPHSAIPLSNLGETQRETQQLDVAIKNFDKAIALEPNNHVAHWNKALALLLAGDLRRGFELYEYRWETLLKGTKRDFPQPLWLGEVSLHGKSILLHAEQGLGDTIQFCRYVPMVAALGARVILEIQKPLVGLLQSVEGVDQVIVRGEQLPDFDCHCPLLSLPLALKTDESSVPRIIGMAGNQETQVKWKERLGNKTRPRVGLVWSGNPDHKNDKNRSISLRQMVDNLPNNCEYFCLQKEVRTADQELLSATTWVRHFGEELIDFTDTAALCELMDVILCVDTSVAHLSATLSRPTWILLPFSVDWRWMLKRSESPWYPSAKLFRQDKFGNWESVLRHIRSELLTLG